MRHRTPDKVKAKSLRPLHRKVHVKGETWSYRVTGSTVVIRDPAGTSTVRVPHDKFTGLNWQQLEDTSRKGAPGYGITPQDVKDFIENGLKPVRYTDQGYRFANSPYKRAEKA